MLKPKLNYFSPLPPLKSGISDYSEELLKELKKHFEITAFIDNTFKPNKIEDIKIKNYNDCKNNYPTIHNIGNSAFHIYSYKKLEKDPGIIILHDSILHSLNFERMQDDWSRLFFLKEVLTNHGPRALFDYIKFFFTKPYLKKRKKKKERHLFEIKRFHQIEKDKDKFRWTNKKSSFMINKENIEEISMEIYTEYYCKINLIANNKSINFKLKSNESKNIKIKLNPSQKLKVKINVHKPLSFLSTIRDPHFRKMGIKIFNIKYKINNKNFYFPLFKEYNHNYFDYFNYMPNKKFLQIKEKIMFSYPLNKRIILSAKGIITHSQHLKNIVKNINPNILIKVIPHGAYLNQPKLTRNKIRKKLNLDKDQFIICSFGKMQKHKRLEQALKAFKEFSKKTNSIYIIIGESDDSININNLIKKLDLEEKVKITDYLTFKEVFEYIYASDVCINMRWPTTGATSGSLIKSLAVGTPCIISDLPENKEFPNNCTFKIKKGDNEINNILEALNELKVKNTRETMSKNAIKYIKENHLWKDKAKEFKNFIMEVYQK